MADKIVGKCAGCGKELRVDAERGHSNISPNNSRLCYDCGKKQQPPK